VKVHDFDDSASEKCGVKQWQYTAYSEKKWKDMFPAYIRSETVRFWQQRGAHKNPLM
jgi:hypothetical protein